MYIGDARYRGIDFTFGFDGRRLELVPHSGEEQKVLQLEPGYTEAGIHYFGSAIPIGSEYLELSPRNSPQTLVVFPASKCFDLNWMPFDSLRVNAVVYMLISGSKQISGVRFRSQYLSKCFNDKRALDISRQQQSPKVSIAAHDEEPIGCGFEYSGVQISAKLGHVVKTVYTPGEPPISIATELTFTFEKPCSYRFIYDVINIGRRFLKFCLQVSDVEYDSINLLGAFSSSSDSDNDNNVLTKYGNCGSFELCNSKEVGTINSKYWIPLGVVDHFEASLFQALANNKVSLRHLPTTERISYWDYARCILLAASFDIEAKRLNPEGVKHGDRALKAREIVVDKLNELENNGDREVRKITKRLKTLMNDEDSFSSRMVQLYKLYKNLFCRLCTEEIDKKAFQAFADRMQELRNALAHGRLVEYSNRIIADSIRLEKIVIAVQLLNLGISESDVIGMMQQSIRH